MSVKPTIDAFVRALQNADDVLLASLFHPNAIWRITPAVPFTAEPLAKVLFGSLKAFTNVFQKWTFEPYNVLILENESKAMVEARATGEPRSADQPVYRNELIMSFELEGSKILRLREYLADGDAAADVAKRMH